MKVQYRVALAILALSILARGLFLEYTSLIDPTESRYANIAADMVGHDNWLTPQIQLSEGLVPYFGKPPLHFWLTAISYELFGIDEWTARLPSFLATLLILAVIYAFTKKAFSRETALVACLIALSSAMLFFLAGGSVIDVTLTSLIAGAVFFLHRFIDTDGHLNRDAYLAAMFCALAFLTKGPVAVVLTFFPFILWSFLRSDFSWMKKLPWLKTSALFILIVSPWFILSEIQNPGFVKYFIWNENIARYLFKDYGDKYGVGHRYFYGTSWLMFFGAFMPWSIVVIPALFKGGIKKTYGWFKEDDRRLFVLSWTLATPLFFTFVKQLHAMYLLPAVPAASIASALLLERAGLQIKMETSQKVFVASLILLIALPLIGSLFIDFSPLLISVVVCIYVCSILFIRSIGGAPTLRTVTSISTFLVCFYLCGLVTVTDYVDENRSSAEVLKYISTTAQDDSIPVVGIYTHHTYSPYWFSNAWENELDGKISIQYLEAKKEPSSEVDFLLVQSNFKDIPKKILEHYARQKSTDKWIVYKKRPDDSVLIREGHAV